VLKEARLQQPKLYKKETIMQLNKLDYNYVAPGEPEHDKTIFRVSASQIHKFTHQTALWYRKNVLKEPLEQETPLVLGTCLHYLAEMYSKNGTISNDDREELYDYLALNRSELVDETEIRFQLTPMWKKLRDHLEMHPIQLSEVHTTKQIAPSIIAGGTIDGIRTLDGSQPTCLEDLRGKTVQLVDFKTVTAVNPPKTVLQEYKQQMYVYASALKAEYDITINEATIIYITKAQTNRLGIVKKDGTRSKLADVEPQVAEVTIQIDEASVTFIDSLIQLIAESVTLFTEQPSLRHILMQHQEYKGNSTELPYIFTEKEEMEI